MIETLVRRIECVPYSDQHSGPRSKGAAHERRGRDLNVPWHFSSDQNGRMKRSDLMNARGRLMACSLSAHDDIADIARRCHSAQMKHREPRPHWRRSELLVVLTFAIAILPTAPAVACSIVLPRDYGGSSQERRDVIQSIQMRAPLWMANVAMLSRSPQRCR